MDVPIANATLLQVYSRDARQPLDGINNNNNWWPFTVNKWTADAFRRSKNRIRKGKGSTLWGLWTAERTCGSLRHCAYFACGRTKRHDILSTRRRHCRRFFIRFDLFNFRWTRYTLHARSSSSRSKWVKKKNIYTSTTVYDWAVIGD